MHKLAALATIVILALVACIDTGPTASARAAPYTLVIGDSITWRGADNLAALRPGWTIDGERKRVIWALEPILQRHIADRGVPETLVVALGTNSMVSDTHLEAWTRQDFVDVLKLLPVSTRVVFVTVYRDSVKYPEATDRMRLISGWMRQLAASRPRTAVAEWRTDVVNNPSLLLDGVHPTDPRGENRWAHLVSWAWSRAHSQ